MRAESEMKTKVDTCHDSNRTLGFCESVFCISFDQAFNKRRFPDLYTGSKRHTNEPSRFSMSHKERIYRSTYSRGANHSYDNRWGLVIWRPIDEWDVQSCLVLFSFSTSLLVCISSGFWRKGLV